MHTSSEANALEDINPEPFHQVPEGRAGVVPLYKSNDTFPNISGAIEY